MTRSRSALPFVVGAVVVLALASCSAPSTMPTPTSHPTSSATSTPTPTPSPEPMFDGTADDNQAYFDAVNRDLIAAGGTLDGGAFVDNLVAHGYPREAMEVTPDKTAIGVGADNIVFSIRFGETCLLGQWGNIGYTSLVAPVLSTGRCIIGTARPA